ncbi:plasmid replication initiator TrfA, partial [Arsenophonus nasoniae]
DLTLPAVEFDTLTGSEIDSNALLKTLREIDDGSMTLGELTLENLNFGDAVTFSDVINILNQALPDGYPSAENQPDNNNLPTNGKSTFAYFDKHLVVSGKGLANASEVGTGTFIGNLLGLGDSAVLTKATPSKTLPAQSPDEAIADVVAASSGCGYCFIDELTNDQILKLASYSQAKNVARYVLKASFNGYTVKYTGEQLDQSDLDVWLECLSRYKQTPLGYTIRFSSYEFLKAIKRNTGKSQYDWLHDTLNRMQSSGIHLSDGKYTYIGSLINEVYRDEETGENCLVLNPKIIACFGDSSWTGIIRDLRLQLKGKPLTKWLYGFYSSHAKPLAIKVETLKELYGSKRCELYKFRYDLKKALIELSSVTKWYCEIDKTDKIIIKKGKIQ